MYNVDISPNVNKDFEIEGIKYHTDEKDLNDFPPLTADMHMTYS